jgi:hypothetical protein
MTHDLPILLCGLVIGVLGGYWAGYERAERSWRSAFEECREAACRWKAYATERAP